MSAFPSPVTSPTASRTPPAKPGIALITRITSPVRPLIATTIGAAESRPITRSCRPSPSRSPVAICTPLGNSPNGRYAVTRSPVTPSNTATSPKPLAVATTTSSVPSPVMSATATRTPPANSPNGKKSAPRRRWSRSERGPDPARPCPTRSRSTASGGGTTAALTVIVNCCGAPVLSLGASFGPLSDTITVTVAVPLAPGAGVKVSFPLASMAGWTLNSAGLLVVTRYVGVWLASSVPPPGENVAKLFWSERAAVLVHRHCRGRQCDRRLVVDRGDGDGQRCWASGRGRPAGAVVLHLEGERRGAVRVGGGGEPQLAGVDVGRGDELRRRSPRRRCWSACRSWAAS